MVSIYWLFFPVFKTRPLGYGNEFRPGLSALLLGVHSGDIWGQVVLQRGGVSSLCGQHT